jgi:hypothetical protein
VLSSGPGSDELGDRENWGRKGSDNDLEAKLARSEGEKNTLVLKDIVHISLIAKMHPKQLPTSCFRTYVP